MRKNCLLTIALFSLFSNLLIAQWNNQYINPVPSQKCDDYNKDPNHQFIFTQFRNANPYDPFYAPLFKHFPEYQQLDVNLFGTATDWSIPTSLHLGPNEPRDPRAFDFAKDGTEKLVVSVLAFKDTEDSNYHAPTDPPNSSIDPIRYEYTENYRVDCLQTDKNGEEISLYSDYGNYCRGGLDNGGYPFPTTLGGHFKLNGYDNNFAVTLLHGPGQNYSNASVQAIVGSSFYEIWPIAEGGPETIIFSIKKMTKLKKGFATFKEVKRFSVQLQAIPSFVPTGSDDEDQRIISSRSR